MKVALGTSWLVKCGLADYSYFLSHALADEGCEVYVVRLSRFGNKDVNYYGHYAEEFPLDVDVIHFQHEYGLYQWQEQHLYQTLKSRLLLYDRKVPIVTTMHSTGNLSADRTVYRNSDAVVVHNAYQAEQFKLPCTVIPMGVQTVKEPKNPELSKRRWGVTDKTVGIFGFITEYKGLELLVRATLNLSDVTLLVGGGWHVDTQTPYMFNIKRYANQTIPGRVRWLGYITEEDLPYFFGACDVMVYPHQMVSESMTLMTALAYHKAVITSNHSAFKEKEQVGAVLTFRDQEDLTGKLKALLNEPDLKTVLEKNAEKYAENNSWRNSANLHIDLYESLAKK